MKGTSEWPKLQSNLDYSKCQGPPDFLRIIGSSNFRNRYFSEMFGSFRLVLIFDCVSIKMESKVSYHTFENKAKQSYMNLHVFFVFIYVLLNNVKWQLISDWRTYVPIKKSGTEMAHGSSKQRSALECNKHTVEYMCMQTTRFSQVYFCIFFFFHVSTFTFFEFSENRLLSVSQNPLFSKWVQT